jgi:hypothetical protein
VTLGIAQTLLALGLILAGFATEIWQLALTQGLMCGLGSGLVSHTYSPFINPHFLYLRPEFHGYTTAH